MHRRLATTFILIVAAAAMHTIAAGWEVEYVGSINRDLHSPTSVAASADMVAVLDPYAGAITFFSPDGPLLREIHLSGDAHSLTRIAGHSYLYCDRDRKSVVLYDFDTDDQRDILGPETGLINPVDITYDGIYLSVLDAGLSAILIFDNTYTLINRLDLVDELGESLVYASSFAYDERLRQYYVVDQVQSRVCIYGVGGTFNGSMIRFGSGEGQITRAGEIGVTADGRLLIADRYQGRIVVLSADGIFLGHFGQGTLGEIPLALPTGLDIDENGLVYAVSTMGASISVYRLPLITDDAEVVTVIDQQPPDGTEIQAGPVTLEASVEAYHAGDKVSGIEFRIFELGNESPLAESARLVPEEFVDLGQGRQRVTARWTPDIELKANTLYLWRSRVQTSDLIGQWSQDKTFAVGAKPGVYWLKQNVPNPFNPETRIAFSIAEECRVGLEIINILGQKVRVLVDGSMTAGEHEVIWDGRDEYGRRAASGLYYYRLSAGTFVETRKMVLLK